MMSSTISWMRKVGPGPYVWRMAVRQCAKRILRRGLTMRLSNGASIFLPPDCGFSSVAWVTQGRVDDGFEELLRWFAPPGTIFFDVGAHFGFYAVFLSDLHSRVVAFEPDARTLPALKRNLARLSDAVLVPAAVSDQAGSLRFVAASSSPESRLLGDGESSGAATVQVAVTTLDSVWAEMGRPQVGSMKIDTEGHETAVLQGGRLMIAQCRPQMLIESTARNLAPHGEWLAGLGYIAIVLGERRHGQSQSVRMLELTELSGAFAPGMILLLPPAARLRPAWARLEAGRIFSRGELATLNSR